VDILPKVSGQKEVLNTVNINTRKDSKKIFCNVELATIIASELKTAHNLEILTLSL
jgi:hypothetical protein